MPADFTQPSLQIILRINLDGTELTAYLIHIARLPLGSFRCRAAISCLKQYIQGLQSNADYGNKHLASVLAFERLNFRETYAPDEGGNEVITNSGDHQAAAKPASSIDYRKGNQTQDNILVKCSKIVYRLCNHMVYSFDILKASQKKRKRWRWLGRKGLWK